ncbi:MAG: T9SS type A sorting domain-containing protein, partial [Bacteroidetes bacterium]|nr:T9SS type A sorting domain-containing protein [Bacteroidota bacterium]
DLSSRVGFNFFQNYSGNSATIRNCRFTNLQFAVYFSAINNYSGGGYATHDFVFENNVIDSCDYGLIIFSFKSPYWLRVKNNAITTYSAGIYFETNTHWSDIYPGNLEFSSNTIHSQQEGIRYGNWNDIILGTELVLKNNMVSSVLPSTLPISYKLKLFNNTFNNKVQATARDSAEIYNNLFANLDTLDGYYPVPGYTYENSAFALYYVPGKLKSNNNNFYTPHFARKVQYNTTASAIPYSVINTYSFTSVPQIYGALGVEKNSLSFTPLFVSNTNLHSQSAYMKNTGCAIPSLTVDIDGDIRPSDPLDIGADEIQIPFTGVWPGDANADLQVTSQDLYSVGLHYGNHHYQRDSVSNAFVGQLCNDWNVNQIGSTVDMKFADCNGDSLIDMNDTLAINLNYNLTHLPKLNATNTNTLDITLEFNKTLYLPGDTVKADVMIGSPVNVQNSIYGASFKIAYEVAKVKPNSEKMIFINSWMGNINSTKIKFSHIDRTQGLLDASVVRITHSDVTGYGKVGTFQFVLNDTQTSQSMGVSIIDADKVNTGAIITPLIPGQDSIIVVPNSVATYVTENTVNEVSVYPNPASDYVKVNFGNIGNATCKLELSAMDGKVILTKTASGNRYTLNLQGVAKGVYALKITMEDGSNKVFKLVIQ